MKALVVYAYTDYSENKKIKISNDFEYFCSDNPTTSEILTFEERHRRYPDVLDTKVINIIKLEN